MSRSGLCLVFLVARCWAFDPYAQNGGEDLSPQPAKAVAIANGKAIPQTLFDESMRKVKVELDSSRYEIERDVLQNLIDQALIEQAAGAQNKTVSAFLSDLENLAIVKDAAVTAIYLTNRTKFDDKTEAQARQEITARLRKDQARQIYDAKLRELRATASIEVLLPRPSVTIPETALRNIKTSPSASVSIVEFSDFECPYCHNAQAIIDRLLAKYPGTIRLSFVQFPLVDVHEHAYDAARASECAASQGGFWEYHNQLWKAKTLSAVTFQQIAQDVLPDADQFKKCLDQNQTAAIVEGDLAVVRSLGISATPTFVVDGSVFRGVPAFEEINSFVAQELRHAETPAAILAAPGSRR